MHSSQHCFSVVKTKIVIEVVYSPYLPVVKLRRVIFKCQILLSENLSLTTGMVKQGLL